jgi:hypothetical protein
MTNLGVTGGGPSGDPAAVARIKAQYPPRPPGYYVVEDSQAFEYMSRLAQFVPALSTVVSGLTTVGNCAVSYGVVGAKAYLAQDLMSFGAIVVVSGRQAQGLALIAAKCIAQEVLGGGGGGFNPCFEKYRITNIFDNVQDTYYVFVGGTNQGWCNWAKYFHQKYGPEPI